jgi:hypothetical protein
VLGCKVYLYIPDQRRVKSGKFNERAKKGILLGFKGHYIYRCYVPLRAHKIVRSLNVRFDKGGFVSEVLDSRLLLLIAKLRLLTNLLIDSTNTKDASKAKDADKATELVKDQDLAKAAEIAKKPPLTAADIDLLADTDSATEQI